jgi:hypothetical protein
MLLDADVHPDHVLVEGIAQAAQGAEHRWRLEHCTRARQRRVYRRIGWSRAPQPSMPVRFSEEAWTCLPGLRDEGQAIAPEEVFTAMSMQRRRLHLDQGAPEWAG